jgi:hypothetical protein
MFKSVSLFRPLVAAAVLSAVSTFNAQAQEKFDVAGVTFVKPEKWKKVAPASSMRAAQLEVHEGSAKADVVFFYFGPGGAGGVAANVDRWLKQFQEPKEKLNAKIEAKKIGDTKVTFVEAEGTFMDGRPFGPKSPKAGYALLGIIVEGPKGAIFIKETGPAKIVAGSKQTARKMVEAALK